MCRLGSTEDIASNHQMLHCFDLKEISTDQVSNSDIFNLRVPEMDIIAMAFVLGSDPKSSLSINIRQDS